MVIKKAIYVWVIGILGMISFAACSTASQGEAPSTSNAALDNIFARKSVRAYLDKEVEKEKIDWMLRAGMAAPSGKDIRPWEFVLVTDRVALDSMLTQARYAIVVCGDVAQSSYWYLDCSAAAQNILLAAEAQGLGAVWTAAYPYEDRIRVVRKYTELPGNIVPLCVIPFGYPATAQEPKQKFDEKKIHYDKF